MVKVACLEVGGPVDGEAHAEGAGENPGRHGSSLLVPTEGGLGVLQVAEDPRVNDGRGTLNADGWREAGWTYRALGRP